MNKTIGRPLEDLFGFLKEYQAKETNKLAQSDSAGLIEQVRVAKAELGDMLERTMDAQHKAVCLRIRQEVAQSEVEGQIRDLERFAKQRLRIQLPFVHL